MKKTLVLLSLLLFLLKMCNKPITESDGLYKPSVSTDYIAHIHLWGSLSGHKIKIDINDTEIYKKSLSNDVPLAGPMDSKEIGLEQPTFKFEITYNQVGQTSSAKTTEKIINFNSSNELFIGVTKSNENDQLIFKIQSEPFIYH